MRPRSLDEFVGQEHILGPGKALRRAIETDRLSSVLFWGPPGCGKSTLAFVIAHTMHCHFENYSAVTSGVAEMRKGDPGRAGATRDHRTTYSSSLTSSIDSTRRSRMPFCPHVESGTVSLIGATTENPYFSINSPLLSRGARLSLRGAERRSRLSSYAARWPTRSADWGPAGGDGARSPGPPGRHGRRGWACARSMPWRWP